MPDLIFMDVQMPEIDGYKCTHILRSHTPYKGLVDRVPIVAMTASAVQGDKEKCIAAGMNDYLCKPILVDTIEHAIVRWCCRSGLGDSAAEGGLSRPVVNTNPAMGFPRGDPMVYTEDQTGQPCQVGHEEECGIGEISDDD